MTTLFRRLTSTSRERARDSRREMAREMDCLPAMVAICVEWCSSSTSLEGSSIEAFDANESALPCY